MVVLFHFGVAVSHRELARLRASFIHDWNGHIVCKLMNQSGLPAMTTTKMNITWNALIFMANQFQKTKVYPNDRVVCVCVATEDYTICTDYSVCTGAVVRCRTVHFDHCMQNYGRHHYHRHYKPPSNQLKTHQTRSRRKRDENGHRDFIAICYDFTTPLL